jgi:CBS domain-containing protein
MKNAAEIMNRKFFAACLTDSIGPLLRQMAELGLGAIPVLDLRGRPLGEATVAEIERAHDMEEVTQRLTRPALCMDQNTPIEVAARALAMNRAVGLLLVDEHGVAVGSLSAIELLRATLGLNGAQSMTQPVDRDACWEEADYLDLGAVHRAPEAPGIILISPSPGLNARDGRSVWAEAASNMRERLDEMLRNPQDNVRLEGMLDVYPRTLRFRCLTVFDAQQREELTHALCSMDGEENARETDRAPADAELVSHTSMVVAKPDPLSNAG